MVSYDGELGRPPGTPGWRCRPPARPRIGQAARDGPADVSGEVTGALQSSLAPGGRGSPGAGEAGAAREGSSNSGQVCGFEVIGQLKIHLRPLRNWGDGCPLEATLMAFAIGRPDWTWDRCVGPSRRLGSYVRPRLHASLRRCGRSRRLPRRAGGCEAPSGTRFGAARLEVSSRWGRVAPGLRREAFLGVQRRFAHQQNDLPFFCYSCYFGMAAGRCTWRRRMRAFVGLDRQGAHGNKADTSRAPVGAQRVRRVHGRPPRG